MKVSIGIDYIGMKVEFANTCDHCFLKEVDKSIFCSNTEVECSISKVHWFLLYRTFVLKPAV